MKKFLINILCYIIVLLIIIISINELYICRDRKNKYDTDKYEMMTDGIEVCNFGSSHGVFSFNYEQFDKKYNCFNFGLSSQYPSYDFRIYKNYKKYMKKGCIIFIPISYFTFIGENEENDITFESRNKRYYKILPNSMVKQYDPFVDFFVTRMPSLTMGYDIFNIFKKDSGEEIDYYLMDADDIDLESDVDSSASRHILINKVNEAGEYIINENEINSIYYLIEDSKKEGFIPILITTPYLEEYCEKIKKIDNKFLNFFYKQIDEIVEKEKILYFDYSQNELFSKDHSLFVNGDHLNYDGSIIFTDIIFKEIVGKNQ